MDGSEACRRSPLVGYRRNYIKDDDTDDKSAIVAARNLEEQLRIHVLAAELIAPGDYDQLPLPDCIETVLRDLPEVIEYLENPTSTFPEGRPYTGQTPPTLCLRLRRPMASSARRGAAAQSQALGGL